MVIWGWVYGIALPRLHWSSWYSTHINTPSPPTSRRSPAVSPCRLWNHAGTLPGNFEFSLLGTDPIRRRGTTAPLNLQNGSVDGPNMLFHMAIFLWKPNNERDDSGFCITRSKNLKSSPLLGQGRPYHIYQWPYQWRQTLIWSPLPNGNVLRGKNYGA